MGVLSGGDCSGGRLSGGECPTFSKTINGGLDQYGKVQSLNGIGVKGLRITVNIYTI